MFEKGNTLGTGRPKGSKNKMTKAVEMCEELELNPIAEAIKELKEVDDHEKRAMLWLKVADFVFAKPKDKQEIEIGGLEQLVIVRKEKPSKEN
jgi:hypothetical protein